MQQHTRMLVFGLFLVGMAWVTGFLLRTPPATTTPQKPLHTCSDSTHVTCDSSCTCDGMDCGSPED